MTTHYYDSATVGTGYVGGTATMSWTIRHELSAGDLFPADRGLRFELRQSGSTTLGTNRTVDTPGGNLVKAVTKYSSGSTSFSLDNFDAGSAKFYYGWSPSQLGHKTFQIYDSADFTVTGAYNFYQNKDFSTFWKDGHEFRSYFTVDNKYDHNNQNLSGYKMKLVLSENQTFSNSDIMLMDIKLSDLKDEANGEFDFSDVGNLPDDLPKGDYYIGLIQDWNSQYREDNENNNTKLIKKITVGNPTTGESDFNDDGHDDILFFNAKTNGIGQIEMEGKSWSSLGKAGANWEAKGTGIFDGDDQSADVLWFNTATGWTGRFDMEDGVSRWSQIGRASAGWEVVEGADFNGDDIDDILWFNDAKNKAGQYRMDDEGKATWYSLGKAGNGWEIAGTGDFNNDGVDDILWKHSSGSMGQYRMSESGFSWKAEKKLGANWDVAGVGDFNGDGDDDILVFNDAGNKLGYFEMYSSGSSWVALGDTGEGWSVEGVGDFNNDTKADILWRSDDGKLGSYNMTGYSTYEWDAIAQAGSDWEVML